MSSSTSPLPPPPPEQLRSISPLMPLSASMIKPTNAGLIPSPSNFRETQHQQTPSPNFSSDLFKHELLERQTQLSRCSGGLSSIEDRIKTRKDEQRYNPPMTNEALNVPEKLLSTLQRDKRPFAYSPDVNDPNNRGKLDLSQIKSLAMRRRLMANMESDDNEESLDLNQDDEGSSQTTNSYDGSTTENHIHMENKLNIQTLPIYREVSQPPIHYHEQPKFYNMTPQPQASAHYSERAQKRGDYPDNLDAELAESIESLSQFVNNLNLQEPPDMNQVNQQSRTKPNSEMQSSQRVSTFLPASGTPSSTAYDIMRDHETSRPSFYSTLPSGRTVPDYLLPSDTSYFTPNPSPYSISAYYGGPLDLGRGELAPGPARGETGKPTTYKTFSLHSDQLNTNNDGRTANSRASGMRRIEPVCAPSQSSDLTMDQRIRALRQMTAELETEVNRLQKIELSRF